jgi:hypothetical protein
MKKIMFNDRYGLMGAVLRGDKTMTRRIVPIDLYNQTDWKAVAEGDLEAVVDGEGYCHDIRECGRYYIGEEVAVAQKYKDCWDIYQERWEAKKDSFDWLTPDAILGDQADKVKGWTNKMFVRADLMPYRIRITNIKVERLQDISEEDAMREGVFMYDKPPLHHEGEMFAPWPPSVRPYKWNNLIYRCTARYAFAYLIDKISGGGTWNRNPWVFAYEFELLR